MSPDVSAEAVGAFCEKQMTVRKRPLQAVSRSSFRAKLQRVGDREQETRAARRVVGRAVAEREGDAEIGLEVVPEEEADAGAGRGQGQSITNVVAVVPDRAGVDKAVDLITGEIAIARPLIEPQFKRSG